MRASTSMQLPKVGIGTIGAGSRATATELSIKERLDSFALALDLGANLYDVGEDYEGGLTEEILGRFAKGQRQRLLIATKFTPQHAAYSALLQAAEDSLRRLQTDYIDLYQMHWPNPAVPLDETMTALERLLQDGKIRSIGLSNCSMQYARRANAYLEKSEIATNQVKVNAFDRPTIREPGYFEEAGRARMVTIAYGVFSQGRMKFDSKVDALFTRICQKYSISRSQLLIAWTLTFPNTIALIRSTKQDHIRSNIAAADIALDAFDAKQILDHLNIEIQRIAVAQISVIDNDPDVSHTIYLSMDEALRNPRGLWPDVQTIAREIQDGEPFRPVELIRDGTQYRLVQGRMRYWAWRYLYGDSAEIPAIVTAHA
jgi:aryl-alcohol dehydrogenase-like predicted oxidoreductase